jgi:hypothetical protein
LFETFVVNFLMRIVGFLIRSCLILAGLAAICILLVIELAVFILWLILPFVIVLLFISGLKLLL